MAKKENIGHNLNGESVLDRYKSVCNNVGENLLYMGYAYSNETKVAKKILDLWMNSYEHKENILKVKWEKIGIGIVKTEKKIYATQVFCKKSDIFKRPVSGHSISGFILIVAMILVFFRRI